MTLNRIQEAMGHALIEQLMTERLELTDRELSAVPVEILIDTLQRFVRSLKRADERLKAAGLEPEWKASEDG